VISWSGGSLSVMSASKRNAGCGRGLRQWLVALGLGLALGARVGAQPLHPVIEREEKVYSFENANNGAGPLWCSGSTCLVRIGTNVFASGLETLKNFPPLSNCRWLLFQDTVNGWKVERADPKDRTREPCPMVGFPDGRLFLSANPSIQTNLAESGPARPQIYQFAAGNLASPFLPLQPVWPDDPKFNEHSYRSFAADGPNHEFILFQNVGYTHAVWTFRDRLGTWSAQGELKWPWGASYEKPEPIRVCYPDVAVRDRAVYLCGVSDIVEPRSDWRQFKKQLTGREWDYDFRRLFYTWTPDIRTGKFHEWIEIASRDQTCGWIWPGDLWAAPDGSVHLLWTERALDGRLREKFFPDAKQSHALNYAIVRNGQVILRRTLAEAREGGPAEIPSAGRFQVGPENRLYVLFYVNGRGAAGQAISENRVLEIQTGGAPSAAVRIPLTVPFVNYFTATVRGGSPPSDTVEMLGQRTDTSAAISYARVRLR
jgi:hypothetical protein